MILQALRHGFTASELVDIGTSGMLTAAAETRVKPTTSDSGLRPNLHGIFPRKRQRVTPRRWSNSVIRPHEHARGTFSAFARYVSVNFLNKENVTCARH